MLTFNLIPSQYSHCILVHEFAEITCTNSSLQKKKKRKKNLLIKYHTAQKISFNAILTLKE